MQIEENPQDQDIAVFNDGGLLVYPTEAVMGIGCNPEDERAVRALLALKQRAVEKGLILLAANYSQLLPYVNDQAIPLEKRFEIFSSWPGAVTWLIPKSQHTPTWITGKYDTVAVRVPAHDGARALCEKLGSPIVSTSANLAGHEPAKTIDEAKQVFGDRAHYIEGVVGGANQPSIIKDAITGTIIRG